jgi:hypothetical protein
MAGFLAASMSKPWHDTRHAAVQKNSGIGVAETGESVTPGKMRKRKRWDSQRASSSQHHSGRCEEGSQAIFNKDQDRSMIPARCEGVLRWTERIKTAG